LFLIHQSVTSATIALLPAGLDAGGPSVLVQTLNAAELSAMATTGQPIPDDIWGVDVSIQGPPGARCALIVSDC
jgi:hypothetical protein